MFVRYMGKKVGEIRSHCLKPWKFSSRRNDARDYLRRKKKMSMKLRDFFIFYFIFYICFARHILVGLGLLFSVSVPPPCYRSRHVKDPGHSAKSCRWQLVTAKHACTVLMWLS